MAAQLAAAMEAAKAKADGEKRRQEEAQQQQAQVAQGSTAEQANHAAATAAGKRDASFVDTKEFLMEHRDKIAQIVNAETLGEDAGEKFQALLQGMHKRAKTILAPG